MDGHTALVEQFVYGIAELRSPALQHGLFGGVVVVELLGVVGGEPGAFFFVGRTAAGS